MDVVASLVPHSVGPVVEWFSSVGMPVAVRDGHSTPSGKQCAPLDGSTTSNYPSSSQDFEQENRDLRCEVSMLKEDVANLAALRAELDRLETGKNNLQLLFHETVKENVEIRRKADRQALLLQRGKCFGCRVRDHPVLMKSDD